MTAKILIPAIIAATVLTACSKSKFTIAPQIDFKSVNDNDFSAGQIIDFEFEVRDKDGDIQDSLFMERSGSACAPLNDVSSFLMPATLVKNDLKANISLVFIYKNPNGGINVPLVGCTEKDDSTTFRFWIKDVAGHTSDTVKSPVIVLRK